MTTPLVQAQIAVYWALMHWDNHNVAFTCLVFGALRCVVVFFRHCLSVSVLLFSCFTLICRLIVTTSGMYSMWSKFCAEQFTESDKAEALALSFVQSFATSLVLNTNGGEGPCLRQLW